MFEKEKAEILQKSEVMFSHNGTSIVVIKVTDVMAILDEYEKAVTKELEG